MIYYQTDLLPCNYDVFTLNPFSDAIEANLGKIDDQLKHGFPIVKIYE